MHTRKNHQINVIVLTALPKIVQIEIALKLLDRMGRGEQLEVLRKLKIKGRTKIHNDISYWGASNYEEGQKTKGEAAEKLLEQVSLEDIIAEFLVFYPTYDLAYTLNDLYSAYINVGVTVNFRGKFSETQPEDIELE